MLYDPAGESSFLNPSAFLPRLADSTLVPAPSGSRFSSEGIPTSNIARGYHSAATLIPDGRIFIAGSNPNEDVTRNMPFATEYRVEYLSPPYLTASRPTFNDLPAQIEFGSTFELETEISMDAKNVKIALVRSAPALVSSPSPDSSQPPFLFERLPEGRKSDLGRADFASQLTPSSSLLVRLRWTSDSSLTRST